MSAKPIPVGEYNAMRHVTPTGAAEELYQARLKQRQVMPIGPAGLAVPPERAIYRPTQDGKLLREINRAAYGAHCERALSEEHRADVTLALAADIERRFPPADMAVVTRYGLTSPTETMIVVPLSRLGHDKPVYFELPAPMDLPHRAANFHVALGGDHPSSAAPVPPETEPYFVKVLETRRDWPRLFAGATGFPGQFKVRTGRWPRWIEIEREFPPIGEWLAEQRALLGSDS